MGSWFRGVVSGWGLVLWWGVWWVAVFCWWGLVSGGGGCDVWGSVPLRPLLNSPPHLLGGLWFLVRVVPLLGGAGCWLVAVLWVAVLFWEGWAGLAGGLSCGLCLGWVVLNLGSWWRFLLAVEVWPSVGWGCFLAEGSVGCVSCRGVVLKLAALFPLGGPTWTVGLFVAPLFLPPRYTTTRLRPSDPVGKLTR